MSNELQILAAFCKDREMYELYFEYMSGVKNLEREIKMMLSIVHHYYTEFKEDSISRENFMTYYELMYPGQRDRDLHLDLIHQIYLLKVNKDLITKILENIIERHVSSRILNKLIPIVEGTDNGKLVEVYQDIEEYIRKLKNPPKALLKLQPCKMSIAELIDTEINYEGLHWHLPVLDDLIGRAKRKKLGLVYAFVDSGKSSFCIAACVNFARQLIDKEDQCIVYAGNEEGAPGLSLRMTQCMLGITKDQLLADPDKAEKDRTANGFHQIHLYDSVYTLNDVVYLLEEHRPRVMFVDQAVKVEGDSTDKEMKAIQKLFNAYREMAKTYDTTIIGVAQGRGECEDKKYLNLSDIYGSRVAIQGELDWAIGIGRVVSDPVYENQRYINIPKNKEGENAKFVTTFDRHLCVWKEA